MKKYKKIISLLIISMLLSSCHDQGDLSESVAITSESTTEITTTDESDISESSASPSEETSDPIDAVIRSEESIEDAWNARLSIEEKSIPNICVAKTGENYEYDCGEGYEDLTVSLNKYLSNPDVVYWFTRYDGRLISAGANGKMINLDVNGNPIAFSDVVADKDIYESALMSTINTNNEKLSPAVTSVYDDEKLVEIFTDLDKVNFLFYGDCLEISVRVTVDSESYNVVLPFNYRENADWIKPQYLPGDGMMISTIEYGSNVLNYIEKYSPESLDETPDNAYNHEIVLTEEVWNFNGRNYVMSCVRYYADGGDVESTKTVPNEKIYMLIVDLSDDNPSVISEKPIDAIPEYLDLTVLESSIS